MEGSQEMQGDGVGNVVMQHKSRSPLIQLIIRCIVPIGDAIEETRFQTRQTPDTRLITQVLYLTPLRSYPAAAGPLAAWHGLMGGYPWIPLRDICSSVGWSLQSCNDCSDPPGVKSGDEQYLALTVSTSTPRTVIVTVTALLLQGYYTGLFPSL
jgi:hypothetical protein